MQCGWENNYGTCRSLGSTAYPELRFALCLYSSMGLFL